MLILYHNNMSTCAAKVRMALAEKGLEWEGVELDIRAGEALEPWYLKINPKGLVPAIEHEGRVITESSIICEYIDDLSDTPALKPESAGNRAQMRSWTGRVDTQIHEVLGTISFISYIRKLYETMPREQIEAHWARMPDQSIADKVRAMLAETPEGSLFKAAVHKVDTFIDDMETSLAASEWLAGPTFSLADIALMPYVNRLDMFGFSGLWEKDSRPRVAQWWLKVQGREAYNTAVTQWLNPRAAQLMATHGNEAWPRVQKILKEGCQAPL